MRRTGETRLRANPVLLHSGMDSTGWQARNGLRDGQVQWRYTSEG